MRSLSECFFDSPRPASQSCPTLFKERGTANSLKQLFLQSRNYLFWWNVA